MPEVPIPIIVPLTYLLGNVPTSAKIPFWIIDPKRPMTMIPPLHAYHPVPSSISCVAIGMNISQAIVPTLPTKIFINIEIYLSSRMPDHIKTNSDPFNVRDKIKLGL